MKQEKKRVFLIVLDSFGIGSLPDAYKYGDEGSNTLRSILGSNEYYTPQMEELGLFQIDGVKELIKDKKERRSKGSYGRLAEVSKGKDTTLGHWEIAGVISKKELPTYPDGFPKEVIEEIEKQTGRKVICNKSYSGTDVIRDYGEKHVETGDLIIYTSADSVLQIAAHEEVIPVETLYRYCEIARNILTKEHGVGRVIARPFTGEVGKFVRTTNRHDYSLVPPGTTCLDVLMEAGYATMGIGKIYDIFAGVGISDTSKMKNNVDGMNQIIECLEKEFTGLCFLNLVDFDMLYGHRNDVDGYAKAATIFDKQLTEFIEGMKEEDILMITADHGCDPGFPGTNHSREYVPFLVYGNKIKENMNIGTRKSFADIGATIVDLFELDKSKISGESFKQIILKGE
ncbi:MAG: phosphopentomutase [Lachnospiraceae bacterium]